MAWEKLEGNIQKAGLWLGWARIKLQQFKYGVETGQKRYDLADVTIDIIKGKSPVFDEIRIFGKDIKDYLYVADTSNHRIQKFSIDGKFIKTWGKQGTANGEFQFPFDIVFFNKKLYVSNKLQKSVDVFDTNGTFINRMAVSNYEIGKIAVTANKLIVPLNLTFAYPNNTMCIVYNLPDLTVAYTLTGIAASSGVLGGVAANETYLFIALQGTNLRGAIKVFRLSDGALLQTFISPENPDVHETLRIWNEKLYAIGLLNGDINNQKVQIFNIAKDGSLSFNSSFGSTGIKAGQFYGSANNTGGVRGLAVSDKGIFVSEVNDGYPGTPNPTDADRVQRFTLGGAYKNKIGKTGTAKGQFNQPYGIESANL